MWNFCFGNQNICFSYQNITTQLIFQDTTLAIISISTKWLHKKRLELSTLQEEAKKMRELAADAADEAMSSELRDDEAKLSSALEAE